jgi:hypothetical protein
MEQQVQGGVIPRNGCGAYALIIMLFIAVVIFSR